MESRYPKNGTLKNLHQAIARISFTLNWECNVIDQFVQHYQINLTLPDTFFCFSQDDILKAHTDNKTLLASFFERNKESYVSLIKEKNPSDLIVTADTNYIPKFIAYLTFKHIPISADSLTLILDTFSYQSGQYFRGDQTNDDNIKSGIAKVQALMVKAMLNTCRELNIHLDVDNLYDHPKLSIDTYELLMKEFADIPCHYPCATFAMFGDKERYLTLRKNDKDDIETVFILMKKIDEIRYESKKIDTHLKMIDFLLENVKKADENIDAILELIIQVRKLGRFSHDERCVKKLFQWLKQSNVSYQRLLIFSEDNFCPPLNDFMKEFNEYSAKSLLQYGLARYPALGYGYLRNIISCLRCFDEVDLLHEIAALVVKCPNSKDILDFVLVTETVSGRWLFLPTNTPNTNGEPRFNFYNAISSIGRNLLEHCLVSYKERIDVPEQEPDSFFNSINRLMFNADVTLTHRFRFNNNDITASEFIELYPDQLNRIRGAILDRTVRHNPLPNPYGRVEQNFPVPQGLFGGLRLAAQPPQAQHQARLNALIRPMHADKQSTHSAAIHKSVSESAVKLFDHYFPGQSKNIISDEMKVTYCDMKIWFIDKIALKFRQRMIDNYKDKHSQEDFFNMVMEARVKDLKEICRRSSGVSSLNESFERITDERETKALQFIENSLSAHKDFRDIHSGLKIVHAYILVWKAIHDDTVFKDKKDQVWNENTLITRLLELKHEYGTKTSCASGIFNLIEFLDKKHPLVKIIRISSANLFHFVKDFLDEKFMQLTANDRNQYALSIYETKKLPADFVSTCRGEFINQHKTSIADELISETDIISWFDTFQGEEGFLQCPEIKQYIQDIHEKNDDEKEPSPQIRPN